MANSDYEKRGIGSITPTATLSVTAYPRDLVLNVKNYFANDGTPPAAGQGIMLNGEIMRIVDVALPKITVARGCADTIPADKHEYGATIWFITLAAGGDGREYMATETIGVKVLMKSGSGAMDLQNAPPNKLQFSQRFARPYPPGRVMVDGEPFYVRSILNVDNMSIDIAWTHRDRITQNDTLQGHEVASIGPEAGTTYRVRVFSAEGVLKRTLAGIAGTSFSYTMAQALADFGQAGTAVAYFVLESMRDGFVSWQSYNIAFSVEPPPVSNGWGRQWNRSWGKV